MNKSHKYSRVFPVQIRPEKWGFIAFVADANGYDRKTVRSKRTYNSKKNARRAAWRVVKNEWGY